MLESQEIEFAEINWNIESELRSAAQMHVKIPTTWNEKYEVSEEGINEFFDWAKKLNTESSIQIIFAKNKTKKVGLICLCSYRVNNEDHAHIYSLWVENEYRQQGIGQQLLKEGESWVKEKGISKMTMNVQASNKKMLSFITKKAFEVESVNLLKKI